jgi:hypothetical protein
VTYLLPFPAFEMGWQLWMHVWDGLDRQAKFDSLGHIRILALAAFVWAILAEHYGVTDVDELFRERTGTRAALSANAATSAVLLAGLFLSQDFIFRAGYLLFGL